MESSKKHIGRCNPPFYYEDKEEWKFYHTHSKRELAAILKDILVCSDAEHWLLEANRRLTTLKNNNLV